MMVAASEYYNKPNYTYTWFPNDSTHYDNVSEVISPHNASDYGNENTWGMGNWGIGILIFVICIFGTVGNGMVIWLLGFRIEKNPFIIYILNLAVADLGLLVLIILITVWYNFLFLPDIFLVIFFLSQLTFSAGQFLLTAISIDRCVAVFFPLWHRFHRPPWLSTVVCAIVWVLSILLSAITCSILKINPDLSMFQQLYQLIVNSVISFPLMTGAAVALFIKVCFIAPSQRGKPLTTILLTLLFFLFLVFPSNVIYILCTYTYVPSYLPQCATALACINSSVNPVIYFLVGRQWRTGQRETMKTILQKVFKEEERCAEETHI